MERQLTDASLLLPIRAADEALFEEYSRFQDSLPGPISKLVFDFRRLQFADPVCAVFIANLARWSWNRGLATAYVNADQHSPAIQFLDDSGVFRTAFNVELRPWAKCRPTTLPLKNLTRQDTHAWLEFDFLPWMIRNSGHRRESLAELTTVIKELVNNIADHTDFDEGYFFAQWFPKMDMIKFSIADFGCGITENARSVRPRSDAEAILWAVADGTSSKSKPNNQGAGLHYLLMNIVDSFRGFITITTHGGRVKFFPRAGKVAYFVDTNFSGFCVGTSIDVNLFTTNIPEAEHHEVDFKWQF